MDQSIIDEALRFKINLQKEYSRWVDTGITSGKELTKNINDFLTEFKLDDCKIKIVSDHSDEGYEIQKICAVTMIDKTENELKKETEEQKHRFLNVLKSMQEMFNLP